MLVKCSHIFFFNWFVKNGLTSSKNLYYHNLGLISYMFEYCTKSYSLNYSEFIHPSLHRSFFKTIFLINLIIFRENDGNNHLTCTCTIRFLTRQIGLYCEALKRCYNNNILKLEYVSLIISLGHNYPFSVRFCVALENKNIKLTLCLICQTSKAFYESLINCK